MPGSPLLRWPAEGYRRVPYQVFHDPAIYTLEMERIFGGPIWTYLGLEAEVSALGDFKTGVIGDTPVVVTRGPSGALHAFVNRCAHRGALVCHEAFGAGRTGFTCPYHAWSYDLAGSLTGVAFRQGVRGQGGMPDDFRLSEHGLAPV